MTDMFRRLIDAATPLPEVNLGDDMEVSFQGGFGSREAIVKVPPTFEMTGQNIEDLRRKVADAAKRSNLAISIVQMKNS